MNCMLKDDLMVSDLMTDAELSAMLGSLGDAEMNGIISQSLGDLNSDVAKVAPKEKS